MKPIKQYLLDEALVLFNEKSFMNVRLLHIADSAFVSVGHLDYHLKNKEEIDLSLYKRLKKKQELLLTEFRVLPLFEDIDYLLHNIYQLHQHYCFFYLDTLEALRAFPEKEEKHRQLPCFQGQKIQFILSFNASRVSFMPPQYPEKFTELVYNFCLTMDNWLSYQYVNGFSSMGKSDNCKDLWSLLGVLFTDMGEKEFR